MMAPMHRDGMKSPAGTLIPKVTIVTTILNIKANESSHIAV